MSVRWVTGDEVYGADPELRRKLEDREVGYVLAIGCDRRVRTDAGPQRPDSIGETTARAPQSLTLTALVTVAGRRWTIEEASKPAKAVELRQPPAGLLQE